MIKYEEMINLNVYRQNTKMQLFNNDKNTCIILNTNNLDNSIKFMKSNYFQHMNLMKSYYIDRIYRFKLFSKTIKDRIEQDDYFKQVKDSCPFIMKTYRNLVNYKNNNIFIDLSHFNELYFTNKPENIKGIKVINNYFNLLSNYVTEANHNKKIMVIDLTNWNDKFKTSTDLLYTKANTPFTIIYNMMMRDITTFKNLNCDILLVHGVNKIRIIPSECDEKSYSQLILNMRKTIKISNTIIKNVETKNNDETKDKKESSKLTKQDIVSLSINNNIKDSIKHNFVGDEESEDLVDVENNIEDKVEETIKESNEDTTEEELEKEVLEKLNNDKSFLLKLDNLSSVARSPYDLKRNKMLYEKQTQIKINNKGETVSSILKKSKAKSLEPKKIKSRSINTDMQEMKLPNFCKEYNDKLLDNDTVAILNCFKDKRVPVYILDIQKEDTSTEFDKKFTYTIKMESADRVRHTLKFDFPKFIDDSYLYLGGNKKMIQNQLMLKPVVKTGPDVVQMCSNYNKIFIRRVGTKVSPKIERFKKLVTQNGSTNSNSLISFKTGNNETANINYITNIEYDEISKEYNNINLLNSKYRFYFNQKDIRNDIETFKLKLIDDDNLLPVCIEDKKNIIYLDVNNEVIKGTQYSLLDYMINVLSTKVPEIMKQFNDLSTGKRFMYSEATIMKKKIPVAFLVMYLEGLTTVLKKANINFRFTDKREQLSDEDKNNKGVIQFADGYLIYDMYPVSNSLLMNALSLIPTKNFNYAEFDKKEIYLTIFDELCNSKIILNAFENFYDLFIDPITLDILEDLKLPTDFVSLTIYASSLLSDNQFIRENNMNVYRLRNNEEVNAYLYKALADAYSYYRVSSTNKHPIKMSIPQDKLIKDLLLAQTIDDYPILNPVCEQIKKSNVSFKGLSGMNMERAYTLEKRAYDPTMKGIISSSSSASAGVGVVKQLAADTQLTSPRGYIKVLESDDQMTSTNSYSMSELLTPCSAQHDDGARILMTMNQSTHIIPSNDYDELLITNGSDEILSQVSSNDFSYKAKDDGKVIEINDKTKLMTLKYKNGEYYIINLDTNIAKNGAGGFYIDNTLSTDLKQGSTFKKNDVLAVNNKYYDIDGRDATYKAGALCKIALTSGYFTFEDSGVVTEKLSKKLTTNVIKKKDVVLGKNSNVEFIVKKGQHVEVGDPLIIFDESYEDDSINKLLANMDSNIQSKLNNISKIPIKASSSGTIQDIKVYYTLDKNDYSPSMVKTINEINKDIIEKKKNIKKYIDNVNSLDITIPSTDKVEAKYGKIKGTDVGEGVMIEFYINHEDKMGVGDKTVFFSALKTVTCKSIPEGQEAYSEYRKDEEISAFLSPVSELARMTKSIEFNVCGNKVLIEAKRQLKEMFEDTSL